MKTTIGVSGMSSQQGVASVTEELYGLEGVEDVEVELQDDGRPSPVTITSNRELAPLEIEVKVADAGYVVI